MARRQLDRGRLFEITTRLKTWKERTFREKIFFWRKYRTIGLTHEQFINLLSEKLAENLKDKFCG